MRAAFRALCACNRCTLLAGSAQEACARYERCRNSVREYHVGRTRPRIPQGPCGFLSTARGLLIPDVCRIERGGMVRVNQCRAERGATGAR